MHTGGVEGLKAGLAPTVMSPSARGLKAFRYSLRKEVNGKDKTYDTVLLLAYF